MAPVSSLTRALTATPEWISNLAKDPGQGTRQGEAIAAKDVYQALIEFAPDGRTTVRLGDEADFIGGHCGNQSWCRGTCSWVTLGTIARDIEPELEERLMRPIGEPLWECGSDGVPVNSPALPAWHIGRTVEVAE